MSKKIYLNPDAIKENTIPIDKIVTVDLAGKQDVISDLDDIRDGAAKGATALQSVPEIYVTKDDLKEKVNKVSYSELKTLRDSSQLVPGQQYRITDYVTTTTQKNTQSVGHQFDIIVTANDENTLNENARAIQHEGDTYFSNSDLSAWQIWYCLDNDAERFAWADGRLYISKYGGYIIKRVREEDFVEEGQQYYAYLSEEDIIVCTKDEKISIGSIFYSADDISYEFGVVDDISGKGVIYRMIDEWGNDCPYDFKNIKFKHPNSSNDTNFYYTFSYNNNGTKDHTIYGKKCFNNKIENFKLRPESFTIDVEIFKLVANIFIANGNDILCTGNIIGNNCYNNSFGLDCCFNKLESVVNSNFGYDCHYNSLKKCNRITLPNYSCYNTFAECDYIEPLPRITPRSISHSTFNNCHHIDIEDYIEFCSFSNIEQGLKNMHSYLKSCIFKNSANSYFSFDCSILDDIILFQDPIGGVVVEQYYTYHNDGTEMCTSISLSNSDIMNVTYAGLKKLMSKSYLKPGYKYRIVDYVTTTSQKDTMSAGHKFNIIVTATSPSTLSEEAKVCPNEDETYFDDANLNAWEIKYCLDNDTDRFAWAGDERIETAIVEGFDTSNCTISVGYSYDDEEGLNKFDNRVSFISQVWNDPANDAYLEGSAIGELITHWGYETDPYGIENCLTLYGLNLDLDDETGEIISEEGLANDRWYYRGIITVDSTDYDYWEKAEWTNDELCYMDKNETTSEKIFFLTDRIVSGEPTIETITQETVIPLEPKGVIYYMKDEHGNEAPYDFKNIMFKYWVSSIDSNYAYTFSSVNNYTLIDSSVYPSCYNNKIDKYISNGLYKLPNNIFCNNDCIDTCYGNVLGLNCYNNEFGGSCYFNRFGDNCYDNRLGKNSTNNSFGVSCSYNRLGENAISNSFGNLCSNNEFGDYCKSNSFGNQCYHNVFYSKTPMSTLPAKYVVNCHVDDGCEINKIVADNYNTTKKLKNLHVRRGVSDINWISQPLTLLDANYEITVAKNSKGEIKVYCEADLIS